MTTITIAANSVDLRTLDDYEPWTKHCLILRPFLNLKHHGLFQSELVMTPVALLKRTQSASIIPCTRRNLLLEYTLQLTNSIQRID